MFKKIAAIKAAVEAGNYTEAGRLLYELIGELSGWSGRSASARSVLKDDDKRAKLVTELEGLQSAVTDEGRAAGGAFFLLLMQMLPEIIKIIKDLKDR
jgi:hypothetical protein